MKNWDDKKILDYLMTSDYNDNLSPEQLKFLLQKFKYFYRIISSKSMSIEMEKKKFDYEVDLLNNTKNEEINQLKSSYSHLLNIYKIVTSRKLTLSERWAGKIKLQSNEII